MRLAREVVKQPGDRAAADRPGPRFARRSCVGFAKDVMAELEIRKRRRGILGYDDLLSRLADALDADDAPAQVRMHRRWPIVLVDEFQDTDPVQWQVIDRAFTGRSTLILIGDPKQAIYAFRGGDIVTYLKRRRDRRRAEDARHELAQRRRTGRPLASGAAGRGARGPADHRARRRRHTTPVRACAGAPYNDPFRLRVVRRETLGRSGTRPFLIDDLRTHIARGPRRRHRRPADQRRHVRR